MSADTGAAVTLGPVAQDFTRASRHSATVDESRTVLAINGLRKHFQLPGEKRVTAVDDITLEVHKGEFIVLLGPSGCGKTTLLRCVAGLDQPDSGRVTISGRPVYDSSKALNLPPEKRNLSMIFQTYALWPHMTTAQNVGYPLRSRGVARDEVRERVKKVLDLVDVSGQANRYPNQMSGGQQQRVALARALVSQSELILFDEPLSNIDAKVREQLRTEMLDMQRTIGFTALYVTHDQSEAMHLAHRIAVLDSGHIAQLDSGKNIYSRPANRYVARFIGRTNELPGTVERVDGEEIEVQSALGIGHATLSGAAVFEGEPCLLTWRPENAFVEKAESEPVHDDAALTLVGEVTARVFVGMSVELLVQVGERTLLAIDGPDSPIEEGDQVHLIVRKGRLLAIQSDDGSPKTETLQVPRAGLT